MRALLAFVVTLFAAAAGVAWYVGAFDGGEKAVAADPATTTQTTTLAPQDVVKDRVARMKAMGKALGDVSKAAEAGTEASALSDNAKLILQTAIDIPGLFPAGTGPDDSGVTETRAKAEIWTKHDDFVADAKKLEDVANKIVAATQTNDSAALSSALGEVGGACKACHDSFRTKSLF